MAWWQAVQGEEPLDELADVRRFSADWEREASLRLRACDPGVLADYDRNGRLRATGTAEQAEAAASRAWLADTLTGRESLLMVRDNAPAARVCAALRAELVSLGLVEESGVPLGLEGWQGVVAGVGDLVQARRNARELAGFDGNTAFPVNRQTYRVTALRTDGGLTVARIAGHTDDGGEVLGTPLQLPSGYVSADLALGYASTVHAAEGRTVDTGHAILGPGADPGGLLVSMTRGRDGNTAWVITQPVASDAPTGQTHTVEARTPRAVLADVLEGALVERTATAQREQADAEARSVATHVDQLVDVLDRHITAGRTGNLLDELTATGALTPQQREALAADEAFGSLERLVRTAELAGHDPRTVLATAVEGRSLDDARSPAQVPHSRITRRLHGELTPRVSDVADLIPRDAPAEWAAWLHDRAEAADTRRRQLGTEIAQQCPAWTERALGPVPDSVVERQDWEHRAGIAAAYRELIDHTDDHDPLGPAPAAGLVEKLALFRAAHDALDLVDAGAEEARMTEGRLRARSHALTREETWAPQYVADQLATVRRRAESAHQDATIWAARADATNDPTAAEQLRQAADTAAREARELAERAESLETADEARGEWYTHTAVTRDNAHRARAELRARGIDPDDPDDRVTAQEWFDAHLVEQADTDHHREIRDEHDLTDAGREHEQRVSELDPIDIRDAATLDPSERTTPTDRDRIPTVDQATAAVSRVQAALVEINQRARAESHEQERMAELAQWNDSHSADVREAGESREAYLDEQVSER